MSNEDFNKVMSYLDIMIVELNKIAAHVGHCSFDEFFDKKENSY